MLNFWAKTYWGTEMDGFGLAGRPYEQTYPQKLGKGLCEDFS
jgi:hypothetical protein